MITGNKIMKKAVKQGVAWLVLMVSMLQMPVVTVQAASAPVTSNTVVATPAPGARDIIKEIIDVVGLKPRFEVREGNVDNAAAVIYNGQRYILYNREFVDEVNNATQTDWAAVSILAHEIGHHLNGHTLSGNGSNPADELEADEFSGFVLRKMGASLADAQAAINLLSEERSSHTHPGRSYRLASISKGWNNADNQIVASANVKPSNKPVVARSQQSVAAARQTPTRPVTQTASRSETASRSNQQVVSKVNFRSLPNEEIYITRDFKLIRVLDSGQKQVIGKVVQTNNRNYPFAFQSSYFGSLFVRTDGYVLNEDGQRVGYLS